jgi:DNA-binding XRE family transcriptional regulator
VISDVTEDIVQAIGDRIKELRTDSTRGHTMSQTGLAAAAEVSVDVIQRLEQHRYTPSIPTLQKIARALDVDFSELVSRPRPVLGPVTRRSGAVALRRAVVSVDDLLGEEIDVEPLDIDTARKTVDYAWIAYWQAHTHDMLPTILPDSLARMRATVRAVSADDRAAAHDLAAQLYQLAGCTLVHLGYVDTAHLAVREALRLAEHGYDPLRPHALKQTVAWLCLNQGRYDESHRVATTAAAAIAPQGDAHLPAWTLYGSLLLTGATAAARAQNRPKAQILMQEARHAAAKTGYRNDYETNFGPHQCQMQAVDVDVVTEHYTEALDQAEKMPPQLQLPMAAKARHKADVALSHTRLGHDGEAIEVMKQIKQAAPQWVAGQRMASMIIRELYDRSTPKELVDLAQTAGLLR